MDSKASWAGARRSTMRVRRERVRAKGVDDVDYSDLLQRIASNAYSNRFFTHFKLYRIGQEFLK